MDYRTTTISFNDFRDALYYPSNPTYIEKWLHDDYDQYVNDGAITIEWKFAKTKYKKECIKWRIPKTKKVFETQIDDGSAFDDWVLTRMTTPYKGAKAPSMTMT